MNKLSSVALALLLASAACTDAAATARQVAAALVQVSESTVRTQPTLEYRLVAFDGKVASVEVWFDAAQGARDSCVVLTSATLDGRSPVESLPLRLGPAAAGQRASAQLHFEGPRWRALWSGLDGEPTEYETVFAHAATTQHAIDKATSDGSYSSSMPLWVRDDSPLHGQMMRSFGDGHGR